MNKTILTIIIVLLAIAGWYFFLRGGNKNLQEAGIQNSSLSKTHNSILSFVGH